MPRKGNDSYLTRLPGKELSDWKQRELYLSKGTPKNTQKIREPINLQADALPYINLYATKSYEPFLFSNDPLRKLCCALLWPACWEAGIQN